MGKQKSFVKFSSQEILKENLLRMKKHQPESSQSKAVGIAKSCKDLGFMNIEEGTQMLVLTGENYTHREGMLKDEFGIIGGICFKTDCLPFCNLAESEASTLETWLDKTFTFFPFLNDELEIE